MAEHGKSSRPSCRTWTRSTPAESTIRAEGRSVRNDHHDRRAGDLQLGGDQERHLHLFDPNVIDEGASTRTGPRRSRERPAAVHRQTCPRPQPQGQSMLPLTRPGSRARFVQVGAAAGRSRRRAVRRSRRLIQQISRSPGPMRSLAATCRRVQDGTPIAMGETARRFPRPGSSSILGPGRPRPRRRLGRVRRSGPRGGRRRSPSRSAGGELQLADEGSVTFIGPRSECYR